MLISETKRLAPKVPDCISSSSSPYQTRGLTDDSGTVMGVAVSLFKSKALPGMIGRLNQLSRQQKVVYDRKLQKVRVFNSLQVSKDYKIYAHRLINRNLARIWPD